MSIQKYRCAKHNLASIATGGRQVYLTPISEVTNTGKNNVGLLIDFSERYPVHETSWRGDASCTIARTVMDRVIDKLGPAVQSLFQRYMAEHIEELRVAALAEAEANRAREVEHCETIVAEMVRAWNAPDSEA